MGYTGSPLPEAEWLSLLETIASGQPTGTSGRLNLPPVILCCVACHRTFVRSAFQQRKAMASGSRDTYCSATCSHTDHATKNHRRCLTCGQRTERKTRKYCARCKQKPLGRKPDHPRVPTVCPMCNAAFPAAWRGARQGYQVYCSKDCANRGHSRRMAARGNPKWKHGATPLREQPHSAKAYRTVRPLILDRDGHKCVACGSEGRLHVHHIDNWPMNNASGNLVTLCATCHQKLHRALDFNPSMNPLPWLSAYATRPLYTTSK